MTIQEALNLYKIPYTVTETTIAGGFSTYRLVATGAGATVAKLQARLTDLMNATGKQLEILNDQTELFLRSRDGQQAFYNYHDYNGYIDYNDPDVPFIVGFNSQGRIIMDSLENARHLLVAGTTGSGKSVFLHNLIHTFCCNSHTWVYLVDCKQVEFSFYEPCAHVVTEVFGQYSAAKMIYHLVDIMEERYKDMLENDCISFSEYIKKKPDTKRCVLVIDELSDLLMDKDAKKAIIPELLRLAQKGRAAGVHIILATQRPDHTVINGTLKGNLPTRIAFNCISTTDSRVILDRGGAERLTGNGDGLYLRNAALQLERIQAPYIDIDRIKPEYRKIS